MKTCRLTGIESFIARRSRMMHVLHDIQKRRELADTLVRTVHTVAYGYEADAVLPEHDLGIKAGLQVVAPDAAHIAGDNAIYFSGLYIRDHTLPIRALEAAPGISVIRIVTIARKSMQLSIVFKQIGRASCRERV